jgi:dephospho-CoA kinase
VVPPPFIGLTGGIGAGKSEALAALERLGAAVLSTDAVVHSIYSEPEVVALVVERWGEDVAPDGVVDRAAVARAAFASPEERSWLEGMLWPRVGEKMMAWRASHEDARALVVEVPLLFESGMENGFDATIAVVADEDVRVARAEARGHHALAERTGRQLTQAEKSARADHVVRNDGGLDELQAALSDVLDRLTA